MHVSHRIVVLVLARINITRRSYIVTVFPRAFRLAFVSRCVTLSRSFFGLLKRSVHLLHVDHFIQILRDVLVRQLDELATFQILFGERARVRRFWVA